MHVFRKFIKWFCRLKLAGKDTFYEYTETSRLDGIWLLRRHRSHGCRRWVWSSVLFQLFILGAYLCSQLWIKFFSYPIVNGVTNNLIITDIPFPGITVCSPKVVNAERVYNYIKDLYIPPNYDIDEIVAGFDFINAFTDSNWKAENKTAFLATEEILQLNNVSIYEAALMVAAGCQDFFHHCFWGVDEFPCDQQHDYLSFRMTTSYLGPCCSFNHRPKNASFAPFASNIFGIDGGLNFIGVEGVGVNVSLGLIVLIHHPMDYTTEAVSTVTITAGSESFIEIFPIVQTASPDALELSRKTRDCLTSDDVEIPNYRQAACILSCQNELIFKTCGCHPYHLLTLQQEFADVECKLRDTHCYSSNYDIFKNVHCDQCLPSCYDVTYSTISYKSDLNFHSFSESKLYHSDYLSNGSFIVRIYFSKETVPSIRKEIVMSWISLLSDLGGVFSLCLGLSVISIVEFVYFCTFRLYTNFQIRGVLLPSRQWN